MKARVAFFTGAPDSLVLPDHIAAFQQEMAAAAADWQFTIYGNALHSFTNQDVDALGNPRIGYDATTHNLLWLALLEFLESSQPRAVASA